MLISPNWCDSVRRVEDVLIEAVGAADRKLPVSMRAILSTSANKQALTHLIRSELRTSGLPIAPLSSGNTDVEYLVWPGIAVFRVKGLNNRGTPSNYPTETALNYHLGNEVDSIPGLPPLPRVDFSYRLASPDYLIQSVELLEWREKTAVRRYRLPIFGQTREVEVAEEFNFPVLPTEIRPKREEVAKRRRPLDRGAEG